MTQLLDLLERTRGRRLLVVGDVMLDRYTWGDAERVSPEAPVLVLRADREEAQLGGAAGVAALARALDASVSLVGAVGDDANGRRVRILLAEAGVESAAVLADPDRSTTAKDRFIGRAMNNQSHPVLRVDREVRHPLRAELESELAEAVTSRVDQYQAILVSDYAKGVCTPRLLARVIAAAAENGVPVLVDPARITDYERYRHATLLTPNRLEAALATGHKLSQPGDALAAGRTLCERYAVEAVLVKLDSEGMALAESGRRGQFFPTRPRPGYDVTGAGDMVLAVVGLCSAAGCDLGLAACLANVAAGLEVERLGVAPVSRAELHAELARMDPSGQDKNVTLNQMMELADAYRRAGKTIVFTNGCFDLLHAGHLACLQEAARLGDVLVVAVNGDRSVRSLKGAGRPVVKESDRADLLAGLGCVGHVLVFDAETPHDLLRRIRPDVLVKGGTCLPEEVVGREVVEAYGGRVCVTAKKEGVSTTRILGAVNGALGIGALATP